jgi:hypothetical protein
MPCLAGLVLQCSPGCSLKRFGEIQGRYMHHFKQQATQSSKNETIELEAFRCKTQLLEAFVKFLPTYGIHQGPGGKAMGRTSPLVQVSLATASLCLAALARPGSASAPRDSSRIVRHWALLASGLRATKKYMGVKSSLLQTNKTVPHRQGNQTTYEDRRPQLFQGQDLVRR